MNPGFIVPALGRPSGGSTYDAEILAHWPSRAVRPELVELAGAWPEPDAAAHSALRAALARFDVTILDGLVGAAHPDAIDAATATGRRVVLLIHLPLADEGGLGAADRTRLETLERASVHAAWRVVATSRSAAEDIARRHGRPDVVAILGGANPAPAAVLHRTPHLLTVGAIGPLKNQLAVARALAGCAGLRWRASLVGPVADPAYAGAVEAALPPGARLTGPRTGADLAATWASGDLLLHPSRVETYGLVVADALAHGIPAIVGRGTGAEEALRAGADVTLRAGADGLDAGASRTLPGTAVDPDDPDELTRALRAWLSDPSLRRTWRRAALRARPHVRTWDAAASEQAGLIHA